MPRFTSFLVTMFVAAVLILSPVNSVAANERSKG